MFCFVITNAQVNFSTPTNYSTYGSPTIIISEDFNGDGNKDLATANQYLGSISILINNGTGSFIVDSNYINSLRPNSLTCNDFNGDGNIDIITSNITDNSLSVYLGNGMGNFQNTNNIVITPIPNNGQSWSIVSADFNGDNNIDLAVGSTIPNSAFISILLGNGSGGFSPPLNINVGSFPYSITVADFNGDGNKDLGFVERDLDKIGILLGNGLGGFSAPTDFTVGDNPYSIANGDFNSDNLVDLAVVNNNSNNVSVLLGNGLGSFSSPSNYNVSLVPTSIFCSDLNNDGKTDLAITNSYIVNTVSVLLGDGIGSFATAINIPTGPGPNSIVCVDFNGDNKIDIATADNEQDSNKVSVLLNLTPTSLKNEFKFDDINIIPNPNNGFIYIDLLKPKTKIEVINTIGGVVYYKEFNGEKINLDLTSIVNGIYFIKIKYEDKIIIKKIIKQ
jgi:hypothetical protein